MTNCHEKGEQRNDNSRHKIMV